MHDNESVELQQNDQSIFAGEEYVHITDYFVVDNDQQPERQERSILEDDVQDNSPSVDAAATVSGAVKKTPN